MAGSQHSQELPIQSPHPSFVLLIVAIASAIIAMIGNGPALPIDSHEAYVARTAEEMLARQDWLLPTFNGEPRINKPPLCYWLVMVTDYFNGADGRVTEWEARVPSIIASIVLAGGTAALGMMWFGPWVGLIAGLIACTSSGFSAYSHSARPEMVYAAWCTLALIAFTNAQLCWAANKRGAAMFAAWAGWLALGLATMSKGPQLPAMLIAGWIVGTIALGERRNIRAVLRPASGLVILAAVSLWWYVLIDRYVPNARELLAAETTTGRMFNYEDFSPWRYLDPYYVYRTFGLVMPWVILYPLALAAPWIFKTHFDSRSRLLWWVILIPMIALHFSIGRRWYYLLPAMAPLTVLMAKFAIDAGEAMIHSGKAALFRTLAVLHVIGLAATIFIFRAVESDQTDPPIFAAGLMLSAAAVVIVWMFRIHHAPHPQPQRVIAAVLLVGAAFLATVQIRSSLWDDKRFDQRAFAMVVEDAVPAGAELIAWKGDWAREVYYNRRQILEVDEPHELNTHLQHPGDTFLLVDQPFKAEFPEFSEVLVAEAKIEGRTRQLWRIADGS